jgi:PBP1b-binding outer membrane lipoprotein LpoB
MMRQGVLLLLVSLLLASCSGQRSYSPNEEFASDPRYRRDFKVAAAPLCDAARRALLSEGYIVSTREAQRLFGGKEFQGDENKHAILNIYISCDQRVGGSTLFVTATEEHFDVKATRQSNSIGFPILAPIYFGTISESDNQVKIRGETVIQAAFYERFYRAVERELRASP